MPFCQAENVAIRKKTYQHGTYMGWNASRAVDGNADQDGTYGSCAWAHNNDDVFKTWWNVDLAASYDVKSIEIYFRTEDAMSQSRRAGVRVYISNSVEEAKNAGLCYIDQMSDFVFPPDHLILRDDSMACSERRGQFVILYIDRPTQTPTRNCPTNTLYSCWANLELCEVEVYACTNGTFGSNCERRCHCKEGGACDVTIGSCPGGCIPGWEGVACDKKCIEGRWGVDCNMTCGQCQDPLNSCIRTNGTCRSCKLGWRGDRCDQACEPGTWGAECAEVCGNCLGTCDPQTGVCSLGCKPGYTGPKCTDECGSGLYGPSCESRCANCREGAPCHHVTGFCPSGCAVGFLGDKCNTECPDGQYGDRCEGTCGLCHEGVHCDHVTGNCPAGCESGWKEDTCQNKCAEGFYGAQCKGECGFCRGGEPCDHVTGTCAAGCEDGWLGEKCKNRCPPGHFGHDCVSTCGTCRDSEPCDHVTGNCSTGCSSGWRGNNCKQPCPSGYYGDACRKSCGHCRHNVTCDHVSGLCMDGCDPEFYGEFCDLALPDPGEEKPAGAADAAGYNPDLSVLIGGILAGVVVVFVGIMLFVLIRRRGCKRATPHKTSVRRSLHSHSNVAIVVDDEHAREHDHHGNPHSHSPTPSRASSLATIKTNCTQSHVTVDDQEVLYVNLKKKTPTPLPFAVPSPKLSTFQRKTMQTAGYELEPTYYNTGTEAMDSAAPGGIPVQQFPAYIRELEADKARIKEEYGKYPHGLKYPHEAGKRPRNKFKNRFAQMFPYDHSRVVLEDEPGEPDTDYINANYIDSVDYPNCYIATQGPNKITLKDFWQMVWQNKSGKIIMLTNLVEEGKNKCERYWPAERSPLVFGYQQVHLVSSQEYPFYTLRVLTLTSRLHPDEPRTIKQFHFTAWPDHGVPDTFEIVSFYKCVLRVPISLPGPMVVHCSAGVGRTGTFVALDALYHYAKRCDTIDVPTFVLKMRQQRMNMIQTLEQYRLLHHALQEALGYGDTTLSRATFHTECLKHIELYNLAKPNRISDEFQKFEELKPKLGNENFLAALRKENVEKNRNLSVLAADRFRPYLSTYIPDTTDYINAVMIPSRTNKNGYVATQLPMRNTIADFWRLVYDHGSHVIVTLNALDEDQEDSCAWWPSNGDSITFGPLVVETLAVETPCSEVTERTFRILRKGIKDSKLVYMITYNDWQAGRNLPVSIDSFLVVLGRANLYRKSFPDAPKIVICLDGATCSGLFVAVNNVLDQAAQDGEVDVFNAVRQIQLRRPQFVKNKDQYLFVYQCVNRHIALTSGMTSDITYGNVAR
ncbi:receptor-type tyrosine-protein phosphatase kappa-like [Mya arenaria]|uniref:receptor-type tyrosine-protein phosphatase kappa-like n=1 Tax=Mya arenaria TaxID=6604 RepID=UPI0022E42A51|nr:receptor-type tyrosine-protein phosphatase kappa-like [Mya arenaria]